MIHIDKNLWFPHTYAEVFELSDLLRQPQENYKKLAGTESEALRQTQVLPLEIIRILSTHENFSLIQKFDKTLGWIVSSSYKSSSLKSFPKLDIKIKLPLEFLLSYLGTPYYWGGLTHAGIDCSGFSQLFYLEVLNKIIPKNSRDQRKLISVKDKSKLLNNDLVFCHPRSKPDFHHVAVMYEGKLWHSSRTGGVKVQTWTEFEVGYGLELMGSITL